MEKKAIEPLLKHNYKICIAENGYELDYLCIECAVSELPKLIGLLPLNEQETIKAEAVKSRWILHSRSEAVKGGLYEYICINGIDDKRYKILEDSENAVTLNEDSALNQKSDENPSEMKLLHDKLKPTIDPKKGAILSFLSENLDSANNTCQLQAYGCERTCANAVAAIIIRLAKLFNKDVMTFNAKVVQEITKVTLPGYEKMGKMKGLDENVLNSDFFANLFNGENNPFKDMLGGMFGMGDNDDDDYDEDDD
jgi:hypothetical protein